MYAGGRGLERARPKAEGRTDRRSAGFDLPDPHALPCHLPTVTEGDRATPARPHHLPAPMPDPTHPRTHPWGDPGPLLLLRSPVFFGPLDRGGGRRCWLLEWCVAVVLRLLRLCDGMFMQRFAGLGRVVTRSGRCLSWRPVALLLPPRFARWVDASTLSRVLFLRLQSWRLFFPHNSG